MAVANATVPRDGGGDKSAIILKLCLSFVRTKTYVEFSIVRKTEKQKIGPSVASHKERMNEAMIHVCMNELCFTSYQCVAKIRPKARSTTHSSQHADGIEHAC